MNLVNWKRVTLITFSDQSVDNLKWLSSRQALEDTAAFIRAMNNAHGWTNPKWIVFGGSYSGTLVSFSKKFLPLPAYA